MAHAPDTSETATVLVAKPSPINMQDWMSVSHWVEKALARGKSTEDAASYFASCQHEKRQLWHLITGDEVTGVVISEVYGHPHGLTVTLPVTAAESVADAVDPLLSNSNFSNAGTVGSTFNQESFLKGLSYGLAQPLFTGLPKPKTDQANKLSATGLLPQVSQHAH